MRATEQAFFEPSTDELRAALDTYESLAPNVVPEPQAPPRRRLDRVRVADTPCDTCSDDYRGLAAAHIATGGGTVYVKWIGALYHGGDPACVEDGLIAVSAEGIRQMAASEDLTERMDAMVAGRTGGDLDVYEWTLFAANGSWIAKSVDYNDFRALGADGAFMDAYIAARPDAHDDVLTWLNSEGYLFTRSEPVRRFERPRAPGLLRRLLARTEYEDRFENSTTGDFLTRLYGADVADELWQLHLEMAEFDNPLIGDAWKALRAMKDARPELDARLREIWDGQ